MTPAGLALNPGSDAAARVVLVAWFVVYVVACHHAAVNVYLLYSDAVFAEMKRHLALRLRAQDRNTAYKYFTPDQVTQLFSVP